MAKQRKSRADVRVRAEQRGPLAAVVFAQRERLGLRQEELADLAGCSARFVHDVEAGKATVQLDKLIEVLDALGLGLAVVEGASGIVIGAGADSANLAAVLGLSSAATGEA